MLGVLASGKRKRHLKAGAGWQAEQIVHRAAHRIRTHVATALRAEGPPHACEQEPQIVMHFGGRPHRGPTRPRGILLLDGHRGRHPLHPVHIGLFHPLQKLLGVGGQRLHVAPLPLGKERVEGERGLPRARGARHHREASSRKIHVQVFQIVLPGAANADQGFHKVRSGIQGEEGVTLTERPGARGVPIRVGLPRIPAVAQGVPASRMITRRSGCVATPSVAAPGGGPRWWWL